MISTPPDLQENPVRPSFRLWRDRNFVALILGLGLSAVGDGAYFIVLGWLKSQVVV